MRYTARTQVLLEPGQRGRLEEIAKGKGVSVGSLIREAVDSYIGTTRNSPSRALEDLFELEAPVSDWDEMEREIVRGAAEGLH